MCELFTPMVGASRFHPNFARAMHEVHALERKVFCEWADGFEDRDGKLAIEFQTTFNSVFWEIYLYAVLKHLRKTVDFNHKTPDFVVTSEPKFTLEAATAQAAAEATNEWETPLENFWGELAALPREPLVDQATIRIANALTNKHSKYTKLYRQLPHVQDRPFVLAIAPFEQPFHYMQLNQAINRVLFGYDKSERDKRTGRERHHFLDGIKKQNGAEIPLGYFRSQGVNEISAVVFSNTATWGKVSSMVRNDRQIALIRTLRFDKNAERIRQEVLKRTEYRETLLDGLCVYYNPFALRPLDPAIFAMPEVANYTFDPSSQILHFSIPDGFLFQRIIATINTY